MAGFIEGVGKGAERFAEYANKLRRAEMDQARQIQQGQAPAPSVFSPSVDQAVNQAASSTVLGGSPLPSQTPVVTSVAPPRMPEPEQEPIEEQVASGRAAPPSIGGPSYARIAGHWEADRDPLRQETRKAIG